MNQKLTDLFNLSNQTPTTIDYNGPATTDIAVVEEKDMLPAQVKEIPGVVEDSEFDKDFDEVRSNLKELIKKGNDALDSIMDVADSSLQPRAFEIAAATLKTMVETNLNLLDIHEKRKKIKDSDSKPVEGGPNVVHNTVVFSGSTSDILKQLKK